jgi:hypothetical protein
VKKLNKSSVVWIMLAVLITFLGFPNWNCRSERQKACPRKIGELIVNTKETPLTAISGLFLMGALVQMLSCAKAPISTLTDQPTNIATRDYVYNGTVRISSYLERFAGPAPVSYRDQVDSRASIDYPWNEFHGLVVRTAGDAVQISYERTPDRDGQSGNLSKVTVFYRFPNDQTVRSKALTLNENGGQSLAYGEVQTDPNQEGVFEFWFEVETDSGAKYWDSRFGKNYGVYLIASECALANFSNVRDGVWPEIHLQGELKAGSALCLDYDAGRAYALGLTDTFYRGQTIRPSVRGWVEFFDGQGRSLNKGEFFIGRIGMPVPAQSELVSVWFQASTYSGLREWDSRNGENYNFPVSR